MRSKTLVSAGTMIIKNMRVLGLACRPVSCLDTIILRPCLITTICYVGMTWNKLLLVLLLLLLLIAVSLLIEKLP